MTVTRRSVAAGLALTAASAAVLASVNEALAQANPAKPEGKQSGPDKTLYDRLGGVFAIAAVVDHFSDAVVKNPVVGQKSKNPQLREWHTQNLKRLLGLKFMRTLWVCEAAGGPFKFSATKPGASPLGLEEAHRNLRISSAEFDAVASELSKRDGRRKKSSPPSRHIRMKSRRALSLAPNPAELEERLGNPGALTFPRWTNQDDV